MIRRYLAPALLCLAMTANGAAAQFASPAQGETVTGHLSLAGAMILLPPGKWIVGGVAREPALQLESADLVSVALLQSDIHGITSVVLAQRNGSVLPQRPDLSAECDSRIAWFTATPVDDAAGGVCAAVLITRVSTRTDVAPAWRIAADYAAERGWPIPPVLMVAAFRVVDRNSLLDVRYATTLSETGAAAARTCSGITAAKDNPAVRRRINGVTRFTTTLLPVIDLARSSDLLALDAAPALPLAEPAVPDLLTRIKLSRIDAMERRGVLATADADTLRSTLRAGSAADPLAAAALTRNEWKSGTYQLAMATGSMGIWTYAAGDPMFALGMVALQNVVLTPMNERLESQVTAIGRSLGLTGHGITLPSIGAPCQ
jgi:hypothetical protein